MEGMEGIRSRIREVVERSGLSAREFSRRARLASESHIGLILLGRTKEIQVRTLEQIAAIGGVSVEYLRTGRSTPASPETASLDEHPDAEFRAAARAFLELRKFSPEAVAIVADYAKATTGRALDADEWFEELLLEHRHRSRGVSLPAAAAKTPPPPPPPHDARARARTKSARAHAPKR